MVCASDDGPAPSCTSADVTSWSSERGYTCPTLRENLGETQEFGDPALEFGQLFDVTAEQVEHVLAGAHRALDPPQRVAVEKLAHPRQREHHLLGG